MTRGGIPRRMHVPLGTVLREWGRLGFVAFGGPPAHVLLLRELVVERRGWIAAREFDDAYAACQLMPGPASTQIAIYCAQRVAGLPGALVGGFGFILPGLLMTLAIAALVLGDAPPEWILGIGAGAAAAVIAVHRAGRDRARAQHAARPARPPRRRLRARRRGRRWSSRARTSCSSCWAPGCSSWPGAAARWAARARVAGRPRRGGGAAGPRVDGAEGRRAVLRRRLRDHPADAGRRGRPARLDDRHGVRQRRRLRPAHARPGHAHGGARRLGRGRPGRGAARVGDRLRAVVPDDPARAASASGGCAAEPHRRGRSSTGPPRRRWARSPARPCRCSGGLEEAWQLAVLGVAGALLAARPGAAARARDRRARRARDRASRRSSTVFLMDLQAEATDVLSRLIRFDTVNPPGDERACQEWLKAYLEDAGLECELIAADGAPERPNLIARLRGAADGPVLGYLSHVDTVLADAGDWQHDPWSGDGARRRRVGPRRRRHEVADGRRGRRRRAPRALRLAPAARRAEGDLGRRRGDRRRARRPVPHRAAAGRRPRRLAAQRGRRRGHALRRAAPLRRLLRREGHVPLPRARPRTRRPRVRPRARRQRAAQAPARAGAARQRPRRVRRGGRAARVPARRSARTRPIPRAPSRACARSIRASPRCRADALGHVRADAHLRGREDQRDPGARRVRGRLPAPARAGRRRRRAAGARAARRRRRRARARVHRGDRRQPLADRHAADGGDRRLGRHRRSGRRGRAGRHARVHRLALVPGRVPGLRRLRLLPAAPPDPVRRPGR